MYNFQFLTIKERHKCGIHYETCGKGSVETIWLSVTAQSHSKVPRTLMRPGCQEKQK